MACRLAVIGNARKAPRAPNSEPKISTHRKAIAGFNTSRKRFRDYAGIRTGGIDEVSGLSSDEILSLIPDGEKKAICMHFPADSDRMSCMRWRIRGLSPEDSIRKVLVDAEIRNNYLKSGKSY